MIFFGLGILIILSNEKCLLKIYRLTMLPFLVLLLRERERERERENEREGGITVYSLNFICQFQILIYSKLY